MISITQFTRKVRLFFGGVNLHTGNIDDFPRSISFRKIKRNKQLFEDFFYTKASVAIDEIRSRRKTIVYTPFFAEKPNAILGLLHRDVTPNIEINRMLSVCDVYDFYPVLLDNPTDIFSCMSKSKYYLAKIGMFHGFGKNNGMRVDFKKIINFQGAEGEVLNKIMTHEGKNLIEYHKDLFLKQYSHIHPNQIIDISTLASKNRVHEIYEKLFELAICDGVLLENFVTENKEIHFIKNIVFDAFIKVWKKTGKKPLITPFEPLDTHHEDFWYYYSAKIFE